METEFIYWRHHTLPGIKVEEVCGADDKPMPLWMDMAYQIYCENGRDGFREIGHFHNGAPFLSAESGRISITHTGRFLAVATLPSTPECDLSEFSERAALGIDAEPSDREQVVRVRGKFLSEEEQMMVPADDVAANVLAWTVKEAVYKAAMQEGLDSVKDITIVKLPGIGPATPVYNKTEFPSVEYGEARVRRGAEEFPMTLYSYLSEGNIVTMAYSPRCAKFVSGGKQD